MTTTKPEAGLLCPSGFDAAIEAAQAAEHAGHDEQEQLAAGVVAYCTFMTATGLKPLVGRRAVGTTPAQDIAQEHASK